MSAEAARKYTHAEYVALEAASETKHEFHAGLIVAMAGGTLEHGRLQASIARVLGGALVAAKRPCNVFGADARVFVEESVRSFYPDASVVCGKRQVAFDDPHAMTNPIVIVEVLSDSTERDDRGAKFASYRKLPSLEEYVLVSQDAKRIELFRRSPEGWVLSEAVGGQSLELRSLGVTIDVDAVYFDPTSE
jgi:Uma2 family endonuclease